MAQVELKNVRKRIGDREIVSGINLSIGDCEFMVLVGPSGCGKTTILRMIAGLEEITEGEILIDGKVANHLTPRERDVAMVFQSYALYPHMTVRENMGFGLKVRGMKSEEIQKLVEETARMLEIDSLLDRFPRQLSGGQRQRVAMGRAIVRKPKLFLFDEPLSNLDAALRGQMRVELKKLHQKIKSTIIYVTHDHVEAMTLADKIAVIHQGTIQQIGTPDEVFNHPVNKFVAGFIGSPKMNFLEGVYSTAEPSKIEGERFVIPVSGRKAKILARWRGEKVEVGIRPQNIEPFDSETMDQNSVATFRGTVEVLEPMGWETYIHLKLKNSSVVAQVRSDVAVNFAPGSEVTFCAPVDKVHIFSLQGKSLDVISTEEENVPAE